MHRELLESFAVAIDAAFGANKSSRSKKKKLQLITINKSENR